MGIKGKRNNIKAGKYSRAFVIPAQLEISDSSTFAANRLILIDPRGLVPETILLTFLENVVEPDLREKVKQWADAGRDWANEFLFADIKGVPVVGDEQK